MAGDLWTPNGMVPTRERGVEPVSREEIIILSKMHEVAQRLHIELRCKACGRSFTGQNNDDPHIKYLSISCHCRELRFTRGA